MKKEERLEQYRQRAIKAVGKAQEQDAIRWAEEATSIVFVFRGSIPEAKVFAKYLNAVGREHGTSNEPAEIHYGYIFPEHEQKEACTFVDFELPYKLYSDFIPKNQEKSTLEIVKRRLIDWAGDEAQPLCDFLDSPIYELSEFYERLTSFATAKFLKDAGFPEIQAAISPEEMKLLREANARYTKRSCEAHRQKESNIAPSVEECPDIGNINLKAAFCQLFPHLPKPKDHFDKVIFGLSTLEKFNNPKKEEESFTARGVGFEGPGLI